MSRSHRNVAVLLIGCLVGILIAAPASASRGALDLGIGMGIISGTVSDDAGGPAIGVAVRLLDEATGTWVPARKTTTGPSGGYTFAGLDASSYHVRFGSTAAGSVPPGGPYVLEWNGDVPAWRGTAPLVITGAEQLVADASLAHGGTVTGQVTRSSGAPPFGPMTVRVYEDATGFGRKVTTGAGGRYSFTSLPQGSYHLRVGDGIYVPPVWYGGTPDRESSTAVVVAAGGTTVANVVIPNTGAPAPNQWIVEPSADRPGAGNTLESISCTSTDWCMAVGSTFDSIEHGLAEVWDGTSWTVLDVPVGGDELDILRAVSCASPTSCMAVGGSSVDEVQRTFAVHWDGTAWTHSPTPNLNERDHFLSGVSCPTEVWCVAVGLAYGDATNPSVMAIWDSGTWQLVPGDDRGSVNGAAAVSCTAPTWCVAVGDQQGGDGTNGALVQVWNGSSWTAMPGPPAPGGGYLVLADVTCLSAAWCVAAGWQYDNGLNSLVVETWDGLAWTLAVAPPGPTIAQLGFQAVSCASTTSCAVVGYVLQGNGSTGTLIEVWDGSTWQYAPSPVYAVTASRLTGVSCIGGPSGCRAVGWSEREGARSTLVLHGPTG